MFLVCDAANGGLFKDKVRSVFHLDPMFINVFQFNQYYLMLRPKILSNIHEVEDLWIDVLPSLGPLPICLPVDMFEDIFDMFRVTVISRLTR